MKKILVAVDGSEPSKEAFEYSLKEAEKVGEKLTILQVIPSFGYEEDLIEEPLKKEIKEAEEFTEKLKRQAQEKKIEVQTEVLVGSDVVTEIARYADENDYDLVVVGSRGKTGLETVRLGSVSTGVINRAHCPVLVVR